MCQLVENVFVTTFQKQLLNEIAAGHDGPQIPESKRVYFQQRYRDRVFDFILSRFDDQRENGLTKAKLARRIGKSPEVINRWLGSPSNLTEDSISDLLLGICAEEPEIGTHSVLNRTPTNYHHLDDQITPKLKINDATSNARSHRLKVG